MTLITAGHTECRNAQVLETEGGGRSGLLAPRLTGHTKL